jgi:hypothetical protein
MSFFFNNNKLYIFFTYVIKTIQSMTENYTSITFHNMIILEFGTNIVGMIYAMFNIMYKEIVT